MDGSIFVWLIIGVVFVVFALHFMASSAEQEIEKKREIQAALQEPPPTDRQLAFIDNLIFEREAEDWMLEIDPVTRDEASDLIEALLECPRRRENG